MYILAVGDYDTENFDNKGDVNKVVLWVIWFAATFLLQVTFMNMLIAIMAEVFTATTEKQ